MEAPRANNSAGTRKVGNGPNRSCAAGQTGAAESIVAAALGSPILAAGIAS